MATAITGPLYQVDVTVNDDYTLPAAAGGVGCRWLIELDFSSTFARGIVTVKGRAAGRGGAWKDIPYTPFDYNANAMAVNPVALAIGGDSLIVVDAPGCEVNLSVSQHVSSQAIRIRATRMVG